MTIKYPMKVQPFRNKFGPAICTLEQALVVIRETWLDSLESFTSTVVHNRVLPLSRSHPGRHLVNINEGNSFTFTKDEHLGRHSGRSTKLRTILRKICVPLKAASPLESKASALVKTV